VPHAETAAAAAAVVAVAAAASTRDDLKRLNLCPANIIMDVDQKQRAYPAAACSSVLRVKAAAERTVIMSGGGQGLRKGLQLCAMHGTSHHPRASRYTMLFNRLVLV
jgi:hypothetical protein